MSSAAEKYLQESAKESAHVRDQFLTESLSQVVAAAQLLSECISRGGKVLICGNGGSAADAQHMAAELVGRLISERRALPAIALTTDSSNLTAVGNDYGFDHIFSRQVEALAKREDVLVAISTSGNSPNVVTAVEAARRIGARVITLTGGTGGRLKAMGDISLNVGEGKNSCRIQETHIFVIHSMVDLMDRFFTPKI